MNQTNDTNKRIAEKCGWRYVEVFEWKDGVRLPLQWHDPSDLPNYTESLDAIREAVLAQDGEFQKRFAVELDNLDDARGYRWAHMLTAADWCAAFLAVVEGRGE